MYLEFERGTHLSYKWEWGDNAEEITDIPMANHRYALPGKSSSKVHIMRYSQGHLTVKVDLECFNSDSNFLFIRNLVQKTSICLILVEGSELLVVSFINQMMVILLCSFCEGLD